MTQRAGLKPLRIRDKTLLPIVQGGMGVGVSASKLSAAVAQLGGMGTISSVDLRRHHPDLMAQTGHLDKEPDARAQIDQANLIALDRDGEKVWKAGAPRQTVTGGRVNWAKRDVDWDDKLIRKAVVMEVSV